MKVEILQHVPFEGIGAMEPWLSAHGAEFGFTRIYEPHSFPEPRQPDLVLVMGGPMSANDLTSCPWLKAEKEFLRKVIRRRVPVLGICLGAQLLANVLGGRVYPNRQREIGWFEVEAVPFSGEGFRFPEKFSAFHWHAETFELPSGSRRLARSEACENQAFQWGDKVIGLQFHLETTSASLNQLIENCREDLAAGRYVQDESEMRDASPAKFAAANRLMGEILGYLTSGS